MPQYRALVPRPVVVAVIAMLAAGGACRDTPTAPLTQTATRTATQNGAKPSSAIDAPGDSAAPEIVFLPPLGPQHTPKGELDTTLAPSVAICSLAGDSCGPDTLARFVSDTGVPDVQRVRLTDKAYAITWNLPNADLATAYRINVTLGNVLVGYTDFKVVPTGYRPQADDTTRFTFLPEQRTLNARFQIFMAPKTLTVLYDQGVHGSPTAGTTAYRYGEHVSYDFQADSGYTNVLVTVDQEYLPQRGRVIMNRAHVLVVSADRIASVAPGDEWILTDGRALLRSTTPVQSAQRFLDRIARITDTTNLSARLARAERILDAADPAALRALDLALAGHTLFAGSGTGVETTVIAPPPSGGGGTVDNFLPGTAASPRLRPSPSLNPSLKPSVDVADADGIGAGITSRSGYEPLTIAYVNGVLTTPFGALFNVDKVALMAREIAWTVAVPFDVRLIYNSTADGNAADPSDNCVRDLARHSDGLGVNSLPIYLKQCDKQHLGPNGLAHALAVLADFAEAGTQLSGILNASTLSHPADADSLAAITSRLSDAGQHIVFVPHSQGNLMVQQGIDIMRQHGHFNPATDTTCIGAVSLAAPTSENWPISSRHLSGIVAAHDVILLLGKNHFTQIQTPLGDSAENEPLRWHRLGRIDALAGALRIKWSMRIHEVVRGYLEQEPIRRYVQAALVHSYKSCALGDVVVSPRGLTLTTGASAAFSTRLLDLNTESLDGRRTVSWSADSQNDRQRAVLLLPDGRVQARYVGETRVYASTATSKTAVGVSVQPAPIAVAIVETLSARWELLFGGLAPAPVGFIPTGPPLNLDDIQETWDGGSCSEHREITLPTGQVGQFSKWCSAVYNVTTDPVPNAVRYDATFFERDHTNNIFTRVGTRPSIRGENSGPQAIMTLLPGPNLLDRVNVTAWDGAGHLLRSGTACAHGCSGWPGFP